MNRTPDEWVEYWEQMRACAPDNVDVVDRAIIAAYRAANVWDLPPQHFNCRSSVDDLIDAGYLPPPPYVQTFGRAIRPDGKPPAHVVGFGRAYVPLQNIPKVRPTNSQRLLRAVLRLLRVKK